MQKVVTARNKTIQRTSISPSFMGTSPELKIPSPKGEGQGFTRDNLANRDRRIVRIRHNQDHPCPEQTAQGRRQTAPRSYQTVAESCRRQLARSWSNLQRVINSTTLILPLSSAGVNRLDQFFLFFFWHSVCICKYHAKKPNDPNLRGVETHTSGPLGPLCGG